MYLNFGNFTLKDVPVKFNFNKSCIWINAGGKVKRASRNLTLTRVVFEFNDLLEKIQDDNHLTLTRVVFEWCNIIGL